MHIYKFQKVGEHKSNKSPSCGANMYFSSCSFRGQKLNSNDFFWCVDMAIWRDFIVGVRKRSFLFSKHFDIRGVVPMFYLKVCDHIDIYIYIYICIRECSTKEKKTTTTTTITAWCRGNVENNGSSNQRRHTQGRDKMRPSTLMLWE